MACPVLIITGIGNRDDPAVCLAESPSCDNIPDPVMIFPAAGLKFQYLLKHGQQITHMALLSCIFLGNLYLQH